MNGIGESMAALLQGRVVNFRSASGAPAFFFLAASDWYWYGAPIVMIGTLLFVLWSIHGAYRYYLRIPHAWGIALASQCVAILSTIIVTLSLDIMYAVRWLL
jgi:hypothetical protein